jgi:hypothetical protein
VSQKGAVFGFAAPADKLVESLCDPSNPRVQLSLVVTRLTEDGFRIIATGNYVAPNETVPLYTKPVMKHLRGQEYDLVRDLIFGLGTRPPKGTGARKLSDQHAESLRPLWLELREDILEAQAEYKPDVRPCGIRFD